MRIPFFRMCLIIFTLEQMPWSDVFFFFLWEFKPCSLAMSPNYFWKLEKNSENLVHFWSCTVMLFLCLSDSDMVNTCFSLTFWWVRRSGRRQWGAHSWLGSGLIGLYSLVGALPFPSACSGFPQESTRLFLWSFYLLLIAVRMFSKGRWEVC